jgi:hypothetical protein
MIMAAIVTEAAPTTWEAALADYEAKRAASDAMPLGTEGEDDALDAWCEAMDHLIVKIPAPNVAAVATKVELAMSRSDFHECYQEAILADLRRLGGSL